MFGAHAKSNTRKAVVTPWFLNNVNAMDIKNVQASVGE